MRTILIVLSFMTCSFLQAQTFFNGDIHQVDLDIMESNNSCFEGFTLEEIEVLKIFHSALTKFDLQDQYKMVGIFIQGESQGVYILHNKVYYQILPATIETYSDLTQKRFLLMRHHRYRQPQLVLYEETLKNGVAFDFFQDHFRVSNYRNSLPVGKQYAYNLLEDKVKIEEAEIIAIDANQPLSYSDTVEVINRNINQYEGFIIERSDSTSVVRQ